MITFGLYCREPGARIEIKNLQGVGIEIKNLQGVPRGVISTNTRRLFQSLRVATAAMPTPYIHVIRQRILSRGSTPRTQR